MLPQNGGVRGSVLRGVPRPLRPLGSGVPTKYTESVDSLLHPVFGHTLGGHSVPTSPRDPCSWYHDFSIFFFRVGIFLNTNSKISWPFFSRELCRKTHTLNSYLKGRGVRIFRAGGEFGETSLLTDVNRRYPRLSRWLFCGVWRFFDLLFGIEILLDLPIYRMSRQQKTWTGWSQEGDDHDAEQQNAESRYHKKTYHKNREQRNRVLVIVL